MKNYFLATLLLLLSSFASLVQAESTFQCRIFEREYRNSTGDYLSILQKIHSLQKRIANDQYSLGRAALQFQTVQDVYNHDVAGLQAALANCSAPTPTPTPVATPSRSFNRTSECERLANKLADVQSSFSRKQASYASKQTRLTSSINSRTASLQQLITLVPTIQQFYESGRALYNASSSSCF